ncbi:hypothetical protein [Desulforhopalus singaporensis]|nr:hypothetical protein [Desulforhopalus singaporensis]
MNTIQNDLINITSKIFFTCLHNLKILLSDNFLFFALQAVFLFIVVFAYIKDWRENHSNEAILHIKINEKTINLFYAFYFGLTGIIVAIILAIDVTKDFRIFWIILDNFGLIYVCLLNKWGRNSILRGAIHIENIRD